MVAAFAWLGGGAFAASLAYFLYTYAVTLGRPAAPGSPVVAPVVIDVLLFTLFAAHHSLFARAWVKRLVVRAVPSSLERSVYVWIASLLLILVCAAWQPLPGALYSHSGWLAVPHLAAVAAGMVLTALAARLLAPLELAGIDQALGRSRVGDDTPVIAFPYNLVRHPIYLGWVLVVFGVPAMTFSRLLMACLTTTYLGVAIPWEERLLVREFGTAYEDYRHRVRWRMIPGLY